MSGWGSQAALDIPDELRPPGWCALGTEFSLLNDPEWPRDREVSLAIEALDPTFVPMLIRWVFLAPADAQTGIRETHVFKYHGIGRTALDIDVTGLSPEEASESHALLQLKGMEIPPGYSGRIPRYLDPTVGILDDPAFLGMESIIRSPAERFGAADLPGPPIPWTWPLVHALRRCYTNSHTAGDLKQSMVRAPLERKQRANRARAQDFAADFANFQQWANKRITAMGDDEVVAELARLQEASRQRRLAAMAQKFQFKLHGVN